MRFFQLSLLSLFFGVLGTAPTPELTERPPDEVKEATAFSTPAPRVFLSRYYKPGVDVAEDNSARLHHEPDADGYRFVGMYGFLFSNPDMVRRWMLLDVDLPHRYDTSKEGWNTSQEVKPAPRPQPGTGGLNIGRVKKASFQPYLGPENYAKLISVYSVQNKDYRAQLSTDKLTDGYVKKKDLGYLITPSGHNKLKTLRGAKRLLRELKPVYQYYHFGKKDWLLAVSEQDIADAKSNHYVSYGLIGYIGKESAQPANCDGSSSDPCPENTHSIRAGTYVKGSCYCKPHPPK